MVRKPRVRLAGCANSMARESAAGGGDLVVGVGSDRRDPRLALPVDVALDVGKLEPAATLGPGLFGARGARRHCVGTFFGVAAGRQRISRGIATRAHRGRSAWDIAALRTGGNAVDCVFSTAGVR